MAELSPRVHRLFSSCSANDLRSFFVTSRVVFDEIVYKDQVIPRNETTGIDVMAALAMTKR